MTPAQALAAGLLADPAQVTDTTGDPRWTPVRVVAHLADPVVLRADPVHLDGPAGWAARNAAVHAGLDLPPIGPDQVLDLALPLATWTRPAPPGARPGALTPGGLAWGWACSAAAVDDRGTTTVHARKKPPVREYARYTPEHAHHDGAGPYKARNVVHPATLAPTLTWWALADPGPLAALLAAVPSLGRLVGHGHGRVLAWTVEPDPEARTRWARRTFPHPDGRLAAIRVPYWHPSRHMPCL